MNGDVAHSEAGPPSLPRKITIPRGIEGYGFKKKKKKGIHGQFISAIDDGSPAQKNDLRVGDRVIAVNEEDVEDFSHSKVVERIRAGGNQVTLLVVDQQCDQHYKNCGMKIPQDKYEIPTVQADVEQNRVVDEERGGNNEEKEGEVIAEQPSKQDAEVANEAENVETTDGSGKYKVESEMKETSKEKGEENMNEAKESAISSPAEDDSSKLDMAAARPKPKRHEVKRATQNWKQKYDDFNKL